MRTLNGMLDRYSTSLKTLCSTSTKFRHNLESAKTWDKRASGTSATEEATTINSRTCFDNRSNPLR
eukprot:433070-Amphidinium_carterae.1